MDAVHSSWQSESIWEQMECDWVQTGCEESSVLGAGAVSESADVCFVDGVQKWAVSLKHTEKQLGNKCRFAGTCRACFWLVKYWKAALCFQCEVWLLEGVSFTWIKCSSVAWSWLLERTLTSSCWEGWGRVAGEEWLSWTTADKPLLDFVWVNTLGARSWVGGTVAGIRWGEMTWTQGEVEEMNKLPFHSSQKGTWLNRERKCQNLQEFCSSETTRAVKYVYQLLRVRCTWHCRAAFWPAAGPADELAQRFWFGPRNRGANPGWGRGRSREVRLCSCWTNCSFWRSSWGETTPCNWDGRPEKNKDRKDTFKMQSVMLKTSLEKLGNPKKSYFFMSFSHDNEIHCLIITTKQN